MKYSDGFFQYLTLVRPSTPKRSAEMVEALSKELKPCPFCGGKAEQKETYKYFGLGKSIPQYYIKCGNSECGLYVATCNRDTVEEAVEIWNRREERET